MSIHFTSAADRKDYRGDVRSSSWNSISSFEIRVAAASGPAYSLRGESELAIFDRPDTTYFNTHFLRALVHARFPLGLVSSVSIEPRYGRMLCGDFEEERYSELSCVLGADIMRGENLWLTFSYEPGYRNYALDGNDLYSDFYLNRVSAMGSLSMPYRLRAQPVRHP